MHRVTIRLSEDEIDWLKRVAPAKKVTTTTYLLISALCSSCRDPTFGQLIGQLHGLEPETPQACNASSDDGSTA